MVRNPGALRAGFLLLCTVVLGTMLAGGAQRSRAYQGEPTPGEQTPAPVPEACGATLANGTNKYEFGACESTDIALLFTPFCPLCTGGMNIVFVMPIEAPESEWMSSSAVHALEMLQAQAGLKPQVGVVVYDHKGAKIAQDLTSDLTVATTAVQQSSSGSDTLGKFDDAARSAIKLLNEGHRDHGVHGKEPCDIVVFFTYVHYTTDPADHEDFIAIKTQNSAAKTLAASGAKLIVGCPAQRSRDTCVVERKLARPLKYYAEPQDDTQVAGYFDSEIQEQSKNVPALNAFSIVQRIPAGLRFGTANIKPSKVVPADDGTGDTILSWNWGPNRLKLNAHYGLTFGILPVTPGDYTLEGWADVTDEHNVSSHTSFEQIDLSAIEDDCVPTPTPVTTSETPAPTAGTPESPTAPPLLTTTATPESTDSPSPESTAATDPTHTPEPTSAASPTPAATATVESTGSPSPMPSATATTAPSPMPSPTATPTPGATSTPVGVPTANPTRTSSSTQHGLFLPLLLREHCKEYWAYPDIVLVVDVSRSTARSTRNGRTELSAAQDTLKSFIHELDLSPDELGQHSQVAVVGFNARAWIAQDLTNDSLKIEAAVDGLTSRVADLTRLDLAFDRGTQVLKGPQHQVGNTPVIILLTDGLPDAVPRAEDGSMDTTVIRAAAKAKAVGIKVYTIAVGAPEDTNRQLLAQCATTAADFYYTPDAEDLHTIYTEIAYSYGCPKWRFWGRR